jgi:hypothetical protein
MPASTEAPAPKRTVTRSSAVFTIRESSQIEAKQGPARVDTGVLSFAMGWLAKRSSTRAGSDWAFLVGANKPGTTVFLARMTSRLAHPTGPPNSQRPARALALAGHLLQTPGSRPCRHQPCGHLWLVRTWLRSRSRKTVAVSLVSKSRSTPALFWSCKHWELPKTSPIQASPVPVRPSPTAKVCTLFTPQKLTT